MSLLVLTRAALIAVFLIPVLVSADEPAPSRAKDLSYGVALFEYYQGNHFQALSELAVAEELSRLKHHKASAQLAKGGISLALGLSQSSESIFQEILTDKQLSLSNAEQDSRTESSSTTMVVNDTQLTNAQLYLAKLNYRQGQYAKSQDYLIALSDGQTTPKVSGHWTLIFNNHLKNGQLEAAGALLNEHAETTSKQNRIEQGDYEQALGHYNLANHYANQKNWPDAQEHYQQALATLSSLDKNDQQLSLILKDKVHTASGYSFFLSEDYESAMAQFRQVGLDSRWANKALLGYGWSALKAKFYTESLRPWQELVTRDALDANVQEALLALPYSFEKIQKKSAALLAYQDAEAHFSQAIGQLDGLRTAVANQSLAEALDRKLNSQEQRSYGWLNLAPLPEQLPETSRYLTELLRSNRFQQQLIDLRDLLQLRNLFDHWQTKTQSFSDLLVQRQIKRQSILASQSLDIYPETIDKLEQARDQSLRDLDQITRENNFLALASGETLELVESLNSLEDNAQILTDAKQLDSNTQTLIKRYQGLLLWQSAEDYSDNLWYKQKQLDALTQALDSAKIQHQRTLDVIDKAPALTPLNTKLAQLTPKLSEQLTQLNTAIDQQENHLRTSLSEVLDEHRNRLQHYLAYSQLSIAKLYDDMQDQSSQQGFAPSNSKLGNKLGNSTSSDSNSSSSESNNSTPDNTELSKPAGGQ